MIDPNMFSQNKTKDTDMALYAPKLPQFDFWLVIRVTFPQFLLSTFKLQYYYHLPCYLECTIFMHFPRFLYYLP